MPKSLNPNVQKVQKALDHFGLKTKILMLPQAARTATQAAQAIDCQLNQIAKSLIFKAQESQKPILIMTSGVNQVNKANLSNYLHETIEIANAGFVLEKTGFTIGGVAPIGHPQPIKTLIDIDLMRHREIWAAGGHPKAVFKLTPKQLEMITRGVIIKVT